MPDALTIHAVDPVAFTRALIRCPDVTPIEGGTLVLLAQTLGPMGFRCERMDFSEDGTPDVANLYARMGRACPVVEFGVVGQTMHKVDERCSAADVEALSRIYERLLDRYFDA